MSASYLLINGGIKVFKKGTHELIGFAYTEELPQKNGQIQRWLLRQVPGEYDFKPWNDAPESLAEWKAMAAKEPPEAFWGVQPALNGIWASGAFYIMAQSTVVHYTNGMDTSALDQITPKYPYVPGALNMVAPGRPARPIDASAGSTPTPAPKPPRPGFDLAAAPRPSGQLVVGDKVLYQPHFVGYCFGHTDVEKLAETMSSFTADEYWVLGFKYQPAGVAAVTTVKDPGDGDEKFSSLAKFKEFVMTKFGTTFSYEVTGCNYYQGEDPPAHL